jgi:hypothetical protein
MIQFESGLRFDLWIHAPGMAKFRFEAEEELKVGDKLEILIITAAYLANSDLSSLPGQNECAGGDEKSSDPLASRESLVKEQCSESHRHHHAELVHRGDLR